MNDLPLMDSAFWKATKQLEQVRQWAHSQTLSPIGLLAAGLTIINASDYWQNLIPGINPESPEIGAQPASIYTLIIGASGAGKNRTIRLAKEMFHFEHNHLPNLGSRFPKTPEGLYGMFLGKVKEDDKTFIKQTCFQALATFTEVAGFLKVNERAGNWLGEAISDMWNGEFPSQELKKEQDTLPQLKKNTHLGITAGGQIGPATELLTGYHELQGLAGRWLCVSGYDNTIPKQQPAVPDHIRIEANYSKPPQGQTSNLLKEPNIVWQAVQQHLYEGATSGEDLPKGHSSHDILQQRKICKALAQLHGNHLNPDLQDWQLAGQVVSYSQQVKEHIIDNASEVLQELNRLKTEQSISQHYQKMSFRNKLEISVQYTWKKIVKKYNKGDTITLTEISNLSSSTARAHAKTAGTSLGAIIAFRGKAHGCLTQQDKKLLIISLPEDLPHVKT